MKLHMNPYDLDGMTITSCKFLACGTGDVNMLSLENLVAVMCGLAEGQGVGKDSPRVYKPLGRRIELIC